MKQVVIGESGVGKSIVCVKNAILNYRGKVILINEKNSLDYLGLDQTDFETVQIEDIKKISSFKKLQVVTHSMTGPIPKKSKEMLLGFIKNYMQDENTLMVIEETANIAPECVRSLMTQNIKADLLLTFQSEEQFTACYGGELNMLDKMRCITTLTWV